MRQAMCIFQKGNAGYIITASLAEERTTYAFMPFRSVAHVRLAEELARTGRVPVQIRWQEQPVDMEVVGMTQDSLTLAAVGRE